MPVNKRKINRSKHNAIVLDTNVLVHDPKAIDVLRNGGNHIFIPFTVLTELDKLKYKPDIGSDVREVTHIIEGIDRDNDYLEIVTRLDFNFYAMSNNDLLFDKQKPDHQILAALNYLYKKHKDSYKTIKFITLDTNLRITARQVLPYRLVEASDYRNDKTEIDFSRWGLRRGGSLIKDVIERKTDDKSCFYYEVLAKDLEKNLEKNNQPSQKTFINDGIICNGTAGDLPSDIVIQDGEPGKWGYRALAIKKTKDHYSLIDKNLSAFGVRPKSMNGTPNWEQYTALYQLLDPSIELVFLQGGAGTGKTLLALASALEQRSIYTKIIVSRPAVHLGDEDTHGFLPGDLEAKMDPWLKPIIQNLNFLKTLDGGSIASRRTNKAMSNKEVIDKCLQENVDDGNKDRAKIIFESLDYIRGQTLPRSFIIIDEAQNLTPHQIKTIITRVGEKSKIVFTGDLGQIDRKRLISRETSGLAYAIKRMIGQPEVGTTVFKQTLRSKLAALADKLL